MNRKSLVFLFIILFSLLYQNESRSSSKKSIEDIFATNDDIQGRGDTFIDYNLYLTEIVPLLFLFQPLQDLIKYTKSFSVKEEQMLKLRNFFVNIDRKIMY